MEIVVLLAPQNWDYMVEDQTIAGCLENTWTPRKCSHLAGMLPKAEKEGEKSAGFSLLSLSNLSVMALIAQIHLEDNC